jgi:ATP-binding cassette subfamily F protein 3
LGNYDAYLYAVNQDIEAGERQAAAAAKRGSTGGSGRMPPAKTATSRPARDQRKVRKETNNVERKIARLDEQKRALNEELLNTTDAAEAVRLHDEITAIAGELAAAEKRWCELQEELGEIA